MSIEFNNQPQQRATPASQTNPQGLNMANHGDFSRVLNQVSANVLTPMREAEKKEKSDLRKDKVKKVMSKQNPDDDSAGESIHHVVLGIKKSIQALQELEEEDELDL